MTAEPSHVVEEPSLTIPRPTPFWRSPFGWLFGVMACVAVLGAVVLIVDVSRPADPIVTIRGIMASKQDFFNDEQVQRLLSTSRSSRAPATGSGSSYSRTERCGSA